MKRNLPGLAFSLHLKIVLFASLSVLLVAIAPDITTAAPIADSITVPCDPTSLVNAITTANANPGSDNLQLAQNCTYTLSEIDNTDATYLNNGLPVITSKVTINGNGATITRDPSASPFRFFMVEPDGLLRLNNLTLSGGLTNAGTVGAPVPDGNDGPNNTPGDPGPAGNPGTNGASGGAIVNLGRLFLSQVTFDGNQTGYGGEGSAGGGGGTGGNADFDDAAGAGGNGGVGGQGGDGGNGGAIYNAGTLTDDDSIFSNNSTGDGGLGGGGGLGGNGGVGSDTVTPLTGKTSGGAGGAGGNGGNGGASGSGAAIYNDGGAVLLNGTQFQNNFAGNGANAGIGGSGGTGGAGSNNVVNSAGGIGGTGGTGGTGGDVGPGAAIFNSGSLTLAAGLVTVTDQNAIAPQAGNGGNGGMAGTSGIPLLNFNGTTGGDGGAGGDGGDGGDGAGIASTGELVVSDTTFSFLVAGNGGDGGTGQNATDGTPGASSFTGQVFSNGGQGGNGGDGGDAGDGGRGGAVAVLDGTATIVTSTFLANGSGLSGAGGNAGNGGNGGPGITAPFQAGEGGDAGNGGNGGDAGVSQGGAIHNGATLVLANSTLISNYTSGYSGIAGNGGTGGNGGSSVTSGKKANLGGDAGNGGNGGSGGPGSFGGGVFNQGSAQLVNVTFSQNLYYNSANLQAGPGGAGAPGNGLQPGKSGTPGSPGAPSSAGGANLGNGGTLQVINTIVDSTALSNTPPPPYPQEQETGPNCLGTLTDGGNNLDSDGSCAFASGKTNPLLDTSGLGNNGGPTQTIAIPMTSPALDGGNNAVCAAAPVNGIDQRGITRPQDANCDIGAFEIVFEPQTNPFSVNTLNDGPPGTCNITTCTLRDAVNAANNLGSPATIQFSVTGEVSVTGDPMTLTNDVTIIGPDDDSVSIIMANGQTQPQLFTIEPDINVTLSNISVWNSSVFAANQATITNHGNLTLFEFGLTGNSSGGPSVTDQYNIISDGTLDIAYSTFSENGGAVLYSSGTLNILGSTFNGNEGFANLITLTGTSTIANSTFTDNELGQPVLTNSGPLTIINNTFANDTNVNNGATEVQGTQITAKNTIFASGTTTCALPITDGGNNIDSGDSCGFSTANNSLVNTDPQLDPNGLLNNGGPTETIALESTSPALEIGNDSVCAAFPVSGVDQRGVKRPQGLACDIGAFEPELGPQTNPFTVNSLDDGPVRSCTVTNCTLRDAVAAANAMDTPATIQIGVSGTLALSGEVMTLTNDLTLSGPNKTPVTIDLTSQPELFSIENQEVNVTLSNLTVQNAAPGLQQIVISSLGNLTLNTVNLVENNMSGAPLLNNAGELNIINSTLSGNNGLLLNSDGFVTISGSTIESNESLNSLFVLDNDTTISNSTLASNTQGAAVLTGDGELTVLNSTFSQNVNTANQGGDIASTKATVTNTILDSGISCTTPITDGGGNIEAGNTCGLNTANGSLVNTDPQLDPDGLANNGGPTQTILILATSPAIDLGVDSVCQAAPVNGVDQRGAGRPKGPHCDTGAVELGATTPPPGCQAPPNTPKLGKPAQGSSIEPTDVLLKWKRIKCAANYEFSVKVVRPGTPTPTFKRVLRTNTVAIRYSIPQLKYDKNYVWKVRACNTYGCSPWSAKGMFETTRRNEVDIQ